MYTTTMTSIVEIVGPVIISAFLFLAVLANFVIRGKRFRLRPTLIGEEVC